MVATLLHDPNYSQLLANLEIIQAADGRTEEKLMMGRGLVAGSPPYFLEVDASINPLHKIKIQVDQL